MKLRLGLLAFSAAAMLGAASTPALATPDNYAFGFSYNDGNEYLTTNGSNSYTNGFQGWVSNGAVNEGGPDNNTNYIAGTYNNNEYADYFVFGLPKAAAGPVTSASFTLSPATITQDFTYVLHDATPYVGSLDDAVSPNPTLYSDLGTGTILGSFGITTGESNGSPLTFNLNSTALSDLNADIAAGDSQFAISGTVLGQVGSTGAVPEPSTWALMIIGIGGIGLMLRRAKKTMGFRFKDALSA